MTQRSFGTQKSGRNNEVVVRRGFAVICSKLQTLIKSEEIKVKGEPANNFSTSFPGSLLEEERPWERGW